MASRRFTDSEIRAYTRNRYEEKVLRVRLQKLQEELGELHDSAAKHRSDLIEECRQMRKTSGGTTAGQISANSPVNALDFSTRVSRPWAYSVMETTYNVAYQEAIIPIPKRIGCGNGSQKSPNKPAVRRSFSSQVPKTARSLPSRLFLKKEHTSPAVLSDTHLVHISENSSDDRETVVGQTAVFNRPPDPSDSFLVNSIKAKTSILLLPPFQGTNKPSPLNHDNVNKSTGGESLSDRTNSVCVNDELEFENDQAESAVKTDAAMSIQSTNVSKDIVDTEKDPDIDKRYYNTKYISLPAMYKIDSEENQNSVRQQMIRRARSRNEYKQKLIAPVIEGTISPARSQNAPELNVNPADTTADNEKTGDITDKTSEPQKEKHEYSDSIKDNELNVFKSLDLGVSDTNCVRPADYVLYRGKTIHNYIRPEERYKLDPLILKRRQNRMDKLTKESATFLKRVNHENIKVEIAFPRSTRKRLLTRLVDENNSKKGHKFTNLDVLFIQNKVEDFIVSISDYIGKQKT